MKEMKWCQESGGKGREGEYHRRLNTDNHKSCRKKKTAILKSCDNFDDFLTYMLSRKE